MNFPTAGITYKCLLATRYIAEIIFDAWKSKSNQESRNEYKRETYVGITISGLHKTNFGFRNHVRFIGHELYFTSYICSA